MNLREHVNRSFMSRAGPAEPRHFMSAITSLFDTRHSIFIKGFGGGVGRGREREGERTRCENIGDGANAATRSPNHFVSHIVLRHFCVAIFSYFYSAIYISRDIAIRCYRMFSLHRRYTTNYREIKFAHLTSDHFRERVRLRFYSKRATRFI